ncbi:DUF5074 domain-containing protein [Pedobacter sp. ASV28]|uniref:DUF5074 domain-containing protein n=1 Tax=Pedobacter sp. ASV28 TaxID=2795123 RepID=UPI0018ED831A|nr:DUF5074 domain-containing protein [Pedobacter sp. ASV28]
MNFKNYFKPAIAITFAVAVFFSSCKKNNEEEKILVREITGTKGIYVLNEGSWGNANSTLSYYDIEKKTVVADFYKQVNGTALGETANDLKVYGSKMYCVVSGTQGKPQSFVDVMNVATGKTIRRISFNSNNDGYMPRYIAFYKNKAYVSRYDGIISRIDTASLSIDAELQLKNGADNAAALEGLAVANGKLYVTNSAHTNPIYSNSLKSKVTVIDLTTFTKNKDIEVGNNPVRIAATENGDLYVITWNDWVTFNEPTLIRISSATDLVVQTENNTDLGAINIVKDQAWATKDIYNSVPIIKSINLSTGKLDKTLINYEASFGSPYGITINPFDNSLVVASMNNKAFVFGQDGKVKYSFETGINPQHAAFNYSYKYEYKIF